MAILLVATGLALKIVHKGGRHFFFAPIKFFWDPNPTEKKKGMSRPAEEPMLLIPLGRKVATCRPTWKSASPPFKRARPSTEASAERGASPSTPETLHAKRIRLFAKDTADSDAFSHVSPETLQAKNRRLEAEIAELKSYASQLHQMLDEEKSKREAAEQCALRVQLQCQNQSGSSSKAGWRAYYDLKRATGGA